MIIRPYYSGISFLDTGACLCAPTAPEPPQCEARQQHHRYHILFPAFLCEPYKYGDEQADHENHHPHISSEFTIVVYHLLC